MGDFLSNKQPNWAACWSKTYSCLLSSYCFWNLICCSCRKIVCCRCFWASKSFPSITNLPWIHPPSFTKYPYPFLGWTPVQETLNTLHSVPHDWPLISSWTWPRWPTRASGFMADNLEGSSRVLHFGALQRYYPPLSTRCNAPGRAKNAPCCQIHRRQDWPVPWRWNSHHLWPWTIWQELPCKANSTLLLLIGWKLLWVPGASDLFTEWSPDG